MSLCMTCARRTYLLSVLRSERSFNVQPPVSVVPTGKAWQRRTSTGVAARPSGAQGVLRERCDKSGTDVEAKRRPGRSASLEWVVQKHLQYLGDDPFKIAQHVRATITRGRFEEALLLTRKASRHSNVTVSWNHLIEHLMIEQRLHAALRLYNEMKKRAQLPNEQTYTIIFNGCAASEHPKLAVAEALRLYHNMLSSDRLKPNIVHLNAVLKVCSRAGDLESLSNLLRSATSSRNPNNLTYTTILNALRVKEPPLLRSADAAGMSPSARLEAHRAEVSVSIQKGKGVWDEVIDRWRHGKLIIDENLVCAMGRLLLSGNKDEKDEVLSLVEQTMGICRPDAGLSATRSVPTEETGAKQEVTDHRGKSPPAPVQAKPGNNTLSMVLHSLGATKKTSSASRYWDVFVGRLGIIPDSDNWFRLLLTLHTGKASTKSSMFLERMPIHMVRPDTLRLVMQTCVADNLNEHAFTNAERVLDVALRTWQDNPDPETMRRYLRAAAANHHRFRRMSERGDAKTATAALGKQLVRALDRVWEPMRLATSDFAGPCLRGPQASTAKRLNELHELAAVARRMTAVAGKVIRDEMAESKTLEKLKERNAKLNRYITAIYALGESAEENRLQEQGHRHPPG